MRTSEKRKILLWVAVLLVCMILFLIFFFGKEKEDKVRIGFILSGSIYEEGWNGMHYEGFRASSKELGTELLVKENIKEFSGECEKSIEDLVNNGASMIILSSYGYSQEVYDVVKKYPEVVFYTNSSQYHAKNMTSYFARLYQARYLSGIIAGMTTQSNQIGYVAAMENYEVNRGINAFALGVKRVNPDATVNVIWTNSWDDEEKERESTRKLIEMGSDVITYHQNQDFVAQEADKNGVYSIGYHSESVNMSPKYLTSVICNWEILYKEIIKQYLQGNANSVDNYWIGLEEDAVSLAEFSSEVSPEIIEEIEKATDEILEGKDVFSGIIYDNNGVLRCDEGELISDKVLLEQFDWIVEGVRIYED